MPIKIFAPDEINIAIMCWVCSVCKEESRIVSVTRSDSKPYTKADIEEAVKFLIKEGMPAKLIPLGWWKESNGKFIKCPKCRGAIQ